MGYSIGYDRRWGRDIGYGVPATCDYPDCGEGIDRGLSYVCGGEPRGGVFGCGLYFCEYHLWVGGEHDHPQMCEACVDETPRFEPTPDIQEWIDHKMTDPSWAAWRKENGL